MALYKQAIRLDPAHTNIGESYFTVATNMAKAFPEKPIRAVNLYEKGLKLDPSHHRSAFNMAVMLWDLGQLSAAKQSLETALSILPSHEPYSTGLAQFQAATKKEL